MIIQNNIGWCDETTNAVTGCDKVSPGCKNCYAATGTRARVLRAQGVETWGQNGIRHPVNFGPVFRRLNKLCICPRCGTAVPFENIGRNCGCFYPHPQLRRLRLFADSNSDWLDTKWQVDTLAAFLDAIRRAPNIDTLLLTKRPENWSSLLHPAMRLIDNETDTWISSWLDGTAPPNVWFGFSGENNDTLWKRWGDAKIVPAAVHFISIEPLLENVSNTLETVLIEANALRLNPWVIVGGESGNGTGASPRRDCGVEAIISVANLCLSFGVPVYVKQDFAFKSGQQGRIPNDIWALKQFPHLAGRSAVSPVAKEGSANFA